VEVNPPLIVDFCCTCSGQLLAQSRHRQRVEGCPLLGVKRTLRFQGAMSAFDPKPTLAAPLLSRRQALIVPARCDLHLSGTQTSSKQKPLNGLRRHIFQLEMQEDTSRAVYHQITPPLLPHPSWGFGSWHTIRGPLKVHILEIFANAGWNFLRKQRLVACSIQGTYPRRLCVKMYAACRAIKSREILAAALMKPADEDTLQRWPVSKRVNGSRAADDDPTLIEPITIT
jgi:hypothetical protein